MFAKISQDFLLVRRFLQRRKLREKTLDLNWRLYLSISYELDDYYVTKTNGAYWRVAEKSTSEDLCSAGSVLEGSYNVDNAFTDALAALEREKYYWSGANRRRVFIFPYSIKISVCNDDGETVYDCGREHSKR